MGIPLWKSLGFFLMVAFVGTVLFPSHRELGLLYSRSRRYSQATAHLAQQFENDTRDVANAIRYLNALSVSGKKAEVERLARPLIEAHPHNASVHQFMASFYEAQFQFEEASAHWEALTRLHPSSEVPWEKLISYYTLNKKPDLLLDLYERWLARGKPIRDKYSLYTLAGLYALRRKGAEAAAIYRRVLELFPRETEAMLRLAEVYDSSGYPQKAQAIYLQFVRSRPKEKDAMMTALHELIRLGKPAEAFSALQFVSEKWAVDEEVLWAISDLGTQYRSYTHECSEWLEKLHARNPEKSQIVRSLAELSMSQGDYPKAERYLRSYHEQTGGDARSHHMLGDLLALLGQSQGSREEYARAIQLLGRK